MPSENLTRIQAARVLEREFGFTHSAARRALHTAVQKQQQGKVREELYPISLQQDRSKIEVQEVKTAALASPTRGADSGVPITPNSDLETILQYVKDHLNTDTVATCAGTKTFFAP